MKKIWKYKIKSKILNIVILLLIPIIALFLVEAYLYKPWHLSIQMFLVNLFFYYLIYGISIFLFGNSRRGSIASTTFFMILGMVNYFVVDFRSTPFVPWDLFSIHVAASVAGNYEFEITGQLVGIVIGFLVLMLLGSRTNISSGSWKKRLAVILACIMCFAGGVKAIGTDSIAKTLGVYTTLFNLDYMYSYNGLVGGFLGMLKYMKVEKPDGYSVDAVQEIGEEYIEEEAWNYDLKELPNVIVIMDEAFSDLSVYGDFETDSDYMPFIRSLEKNTVKGQCYVSVKGGNTANSEYEFLTGDSMAFTPLGSVPYQQYLKEEMPGLASHMKQLGYATNAIHPYRSSGWDRDEVYLRLGFDTLTFENDFERPVYIRKYISDKSAFEKIIEQYEEKGQDERLFTFEVTMQNHGGYSTDVPGFEESVHLTQLEKKSTSVRAAEKYLTLIQETDRAFEELVGYFEQQEEDTIILLFGDHQPSDYITNTILKLLKLNREESDEVYFDNYAVPFIMWANFDIEEEYVDAISLNYLSGLLLEKAGLPLTGYQRFLQDLRQELPVVTSIMAMDENGERMHMESLKECAWLKKYQMLVYNHLEDTKNRIEKFY